MENFYGRVVVGDVPCREKNLGGCTQMVIEVIGNVSREVRTIKSNLKR